MAYKYNPLLGVGLDEVGAGAGGSTSPGGANTQIQFNDGGAFGGDAGLTYNKTTDELTVAGDINLDDGGTFSTTVQSVTPTANRTISFPDATGTVALVSGANGTIQYNDAGTLKGNSDFTIDPDWNDAATVFTGLKLNVTDTASATGSKLLDLQSGGTSKFSVNQEGTIATSNGILTFGPYAGSNPEGFEVTSYGGFAFGTFTTGKRFDINSTFSYGWSTNDLRIWRDDANILAQRNDTAAQTYRLYNTWGNNGVDFERTSITRDSSGLVIDAQKGGTGVDPTNLLDVKLGGTSFASFRVTSGNSALHFPSGSAVFIDSTSTNGILIGNYAGRNIRLGSATSILFSSSSPTGSIDLQIKRDQANVLAVTDGSTGTGYLKLIPTTVGALTPAATVGAGTKAFVTDSTSTLSAHHGQAVVGGGTNFVPVFSDGTNWIVG
jgi:hypothetical protein